MAIVRDRLAGRRARAEAGGAWVRIAADLARLVARLLGVAAHWAWAHHRATVAFRRALRQAGLPPHAVARLTRSYAATDPLALARLALRKRH